MEATMVASGDSPFTRKTELNEFLVLVAFLRNLLVGKDKWIIGTMITVSIWADMVGIG